MNLLSCFSLKHYLFILYCFFLGPLYGQSLSWQVQLNYPIPIDNNFVGENYTGFIDVGAGLKCADFDFIWLEPNINLSVLTF